MLGNSWFVDYIVMHIPERIKSQTFRFCHFKLFDNMLKRFKIELMISEPTIVIESSIGKAECKFLSLVYSRYSIISLLSFLHLYYLFAHHQLFHLPVNDMLGKSWFVDYIALHIPEEVKSQTFKFRHFKLFVNMLKRVKIELMTS